MSEIDTFASSTGYFNVISLDHTKMMKKNAKVGSTGHWDNEIDLAGSEGLEGIKIHNIKPQEMFSSSPLVTI